jgi:SAM-dependent methyltransferase
MRALDLPDRALAGVVDFYSLIHISEAEMMPTLRELRRVLTPGGLLLVGFHVGEETVHRDELWGHAVSLDFRFLVPTRIVASLEEAGFRVLGVTSSRGGRSDDRAESHPRIRRTRPERKSTANTTRRKRARSSLAKSSMPAARPTTAGAAKTQVRRQTSRSSRPAHQ